MTVDHDTNLTTKATPGCKRWGGVVIVCVILLFGMATFMASRTHRSPPVISKENEGLFDTTWRPDGSKCSLHLPSACLNPVTNYITIPEGAAFDTLSAFIDLGGHGGGSFAFTDDDVIGHRTRPVAGKFDDTILDRMLEGSGLTKKMHGDDTISIEETSSR